MKAGAVGMTVTQQEPLQLVSEWNEATQQEPLQPVSEWNEGRRVGMTATQQEPLIAASLLERSALTRYQSASLSTCKESLAERLHYKRFAFSSTTFNALVGKLTLLSEKMGTIHSILQGKRESKIITT